MESNTDIVLIGMMGAGKTTLGQALAKRMNRAFYDSDEEIVKEQKRSVADIFTQDGEASFREFERQKISELLASRGIVLSVGGGAITVPETADLIFGRALTLWVNAPLETLVKRVSGNQDRPLLQGQNPQVALAQKLAERENLYKRANLKIVNDSDLEAAVENCLRQVEEFLIKK